MLCNNCGAQNFDNLRYCSNCGKETIGNNQKVINDEFNSKMAESSVKENPRSRGIILFFAALIGPSLILIILGMQWGTEPGTFNVQEAAVNRLESTNTKSIPIGFVYTNTLAHIAEVLMQKPGGYISNDVAPPGLFLDNIRSWEYGALVMLRDGTTALRDHFARDQSQSFEDRDLAMAEPYLYYTYDSWALPSTESEYKKGVRYLHIYMQRLQNPRSEQKRAKFYSNEANLWRYLEVVIKRLGGISKRLKANADHFERRQTSWLLVDEVFYEARGASWALLHILQAIKVDFGNIFQDKHALSALDRMIYDMENAISPMIMSEDNFGTFSSYSISMANHIVKANAAALDLRDILNENKTEEISENHTNEKKIYKSKKKGIDILIKNNAVNSYNTKYKDARKNKAFAQSDSGSWAWRSNRTTIEHAKTSALIACQAHNKKNEIQYPCKIIDINGSFQTRQLNENKTEE